MWPFILVTLVLKFDSTPPDPNPPGSISDLTKTTSSIDLSWQEAPLMTAAMFHYQLTYTSPQGEEHTTTTNTSHSLTSLLSGTSYNISIATVGAMGFKSEKVHIYKVTTSKGFIYTTNMQALSCLTFTVW